ncbi:class F sortase [Streptomyces sp. DH-12]|uniref:class F sortase n=1 Tax=unclassified Streptomyces TaxID=2593676 RepID=UPI000CCE7EE0|nr:class F sortase [Streptomyces sp. DH-12]PNV34425.1 class F sortase [Streptomyces sp. DH-12]
MTGIARATTKRLPAGAVWAALLLGLWLWGQGLTEVPAGSAGPATGDMAAAGRPPLTDLPTVHRPLKAAEPLTLHIPGLELRAPVVARGLDERGAPDPPPLDRAGEVGWYAAGTAPGAEGAALMVGHVDSRTRPAVFHRLDTLEPGQEIRVARGDGTVAEFTVEDVRVLDRDGFDAQEAYGPRHEGRAELRLITCGGAFDRATGAYEANVVVSAYLTDA